MLRGLAQEIPEVWFAGKCLVMILGQEDYAKEQQGA